MPGATDAAGKFHQGRGIQPGDDIVVIGYPLRGLLASGANVTTGTVSALAGPERRKAEAEQDNS